MANGFFEVPVPRNEPVLGYAPLSPERKALKAELRKMSERTIEIAPRIGGRSVRTGKMAEAVMPHDHRQVLARWHKAGTKEVERAIAAALDARLGWSRMPWQHRAAIFLKAADLLAGPWRATVKQSSPSARRASPTWCSGSATRRESGTTTWWT